jgi:hypothetical protein
MSKRVLCAKAPVLEIMAAAALMSVLKISPLVGGQLKRPGEKNRAHPNRWSIIYL